MGDSDRFKHNGIIRPVLPTAHQDTKASSTVQAPAPNNAKPFIALGSLIFGDDIYTRRWDNGLSDITLSAVIADLIRNGWVMSERQELSGHAVLHALRIYILPSDASRAHIDRSNAKLEAALSLVVRTVDTNPHTWSGTYDASAEQPFDTWASPLDQSLFYIFNNIPSPAPRCSLFSKTKDKYTREAMEDLLNPQWETGLKSELYPYQRRSAAMMLQREQRARLLLDPRLEERKSPNGEPYYYCPRDGTFYKTPVCYESCRGGILAETMGLGKTLICLALILSTRGHLPSIPAQYNKPILRQHSASLQEMALTKIQRCSIPWQVELQRIEHQNGNVNSIIRNKLGASPPSYRVPVMPTRWNRNTVIPPPKVLVLAPTTIIVVPRNLCKQWHSELSKHVNEGALRVLVMEDLRKALPSSEELRTFDIVLFSRNRFELETRDGADDQGRRPPPAHTPLICQCPYIGATRIRDCRCLKPEDVYDSPLKHLHFKRLIVDEGHSFSATNTKAVAVANKLVVADHRWVVSGTPARDLLGVELDLTEMGDVQRAKDIDTVRAESLEQRRRFSSQENQSGAVKSLGALANNFLQMKPWYAGDSGEQGLSWDDHIYRHEDIRKRTYTCYSTALQRTLHSLVVKTQPRDVERDIELPPLSHKIVYLEPSFYDKLTANLFTLVLIANAVTSERTDQDYLFHKNSQKPRQQLIANLRQSAFFWTGFSQEDVLATVKNSRGYLEKENTKCSPADRQLLIELLKTADDILSSRGWESLSQTHELGLFVKDWPSDSAEHWAFDDSIDPMLTGVSQLLVAQEHVNRRTQQEDPGEGLSGVGIKSLTAARRRESNSKQDKPILTKSGIPSSSVGGEPTLKRKGSLSGGSRTSPTKLRKIEALTTSTAAQIEGEENDSPPSTPPKMKTITNVPDLPDDSSYRKTQIVGSTSAKLSYLMSQILRYYRDEKILVFYDGDNVAYYIAQMLELMHIKHEIYAKSLMAALKSEYVVRFDQEAQDRVLLMDVRQAAFGLNISSASRIYFVNPVCRPNVEAQAIKRAHRIGQTRMVHVETLILRGTVEEKMQERAKRMTRSEHLDAKVLEDDGGIREIIQCAQMIPLESAERSIEGQIAFLEEPQQFWGREGWREAYVAQDRPVRERKRADGHRTSKVASPKARAQGKGGSSTKQRVDVAVKDADEPVLG